MNTKDHILEVATSLFGKYGFSSVSIRDIAKEAQVNVAAVNYHFQNKKLLLEEVFIYSYEWLEKQIDHLASHEDITLKTLAHKTLLLYLDNKMKCLNTFRIFISEDLELFDDFFEHSTPGGPPGFNAFLKVLNREFDQSLPASQKEWAVRALFNYLCHTGIVMATMDIKNRLDRYPWMKKENIEIEISNMVESITLFLKNEQLKHQS